MSPSTRKSANLTSLVWVASFSFLLPFALGEGEGEGEGEGKGEVCGNSQSCCYDDSLPEPGCEDVNCCMAVCAIKPSCCEQAWHVGCSLIAFGLEICPCRKECGEGGDCCEVHGGKACLEVDCCEAICAIDPFCCDIAWDTICVDEAEAEPLCDEGACLSPTRECGGGGDCCEVHGGKACQEVDCCEAICTVDPFCCETAWDSTCVEGAKNESLCDDGACGLCDTWLCDGDANGDGVVDPLDSGYVVSRFGLDPCVEGCAANLNCDGTIGPLDSGYVMSRFGTCEEPVECEVDCD